MAAGSSDELLGAIVAHRPIWSCNHAEALALAHRFGVASGVPDDGEADGGTLCRGLADCLRAPVIVRDGARGVWVCAQPGGGPIHAPAPEVTPVDTNGAGDCHAGAVCAELLAGRRLVDAVRVANVAAALSVTRRGPAICPMRGEVEALAARSGIRI